MKIISGGQTGVDRMGLEVAKELGFDTGGTAPRDYRTETGNDPSLQSFGLVTHSSRSYGPRTLINVVDSDGTVLFGDLSSPGSRATIRYCKAHNKPCIANPSVQGLLHFIRSRHIQVLNVAGNRASKLSPSWLFAYRATLRMALSVIRELGKS